MNTITTISVDLFSAGFVISKETYAKRECIKIHAIGHEYFILICSLPENGFLVKHHGIPGRDYFFTNIHDFYKEELNIVKNCVMKDAFTDQLVDCLENVIECYELIGD